MITCIHIYFSIYDFSEIQLTQHLRFMTKHVVKKILWKSFTSQTSCWKHSLKPTTARLLKHWGLVGSASSGKLAVTGSVSPIPIPITLQKTNVWQWIHPKKTNGWIPKVDQNSHSWSQRYIWKTVILDIDLLDFWGVKTYHEWRCFNNWTGDAWCARQRHHLGIGRALDSGSVDLCERNGAIWRYPLVSFWFLLW